jgi:hypothetical protein
VHLQVVAGLDERAVTGRQDDDLELGGGVALGDRQGRLLTVRTGGVGQGLHDFSLVVG